jgi:hypothetical protein
MKRLLLPFLLLPWASLSWTVTPIIKDALLLPVRKIQETSETNAHVPSSRRQLLACASAVLTSSAAISTLALQPAFAASDPPVYYDAGEVKQAFDAIRYELENSEGGISYLQSCVDKTDYDAIFEFTKTYDLEFRKAKMLGAKKKFKFGGDQATMLLNSVTFDLIGMNKACRKGQQDIQLAQKYLDELKADVAKYLNFQSTILVQQA